MQACRPIHATPCIQYDATSPSRLAGFLLDNGAPQIKEWQGSVLDTDSEKTGLFYSIIRGERHSMYIKPGHWLRAIGPGQFSVCSDETFRATYQLV